MIMGTGGGGGGGGGGDTVILLNPPLITMRIIHYGALSIPIQFLYAARGGFMRLTVWLYGPCSY
eukprot:COSAG06_NODE_3667_length_5042_cov_2.098321_4_plen_64_part_00